MSAPPIGMIMRKPRPRARSAISQNNTCWPPEATNPMTSRSSRIARPRLSQCCPAKVMGAPFISACSLANAIRLPENVIAPMARPSDISTRLWVCMAPGMPMLNACGAFSAAAATNTAARPTSEWNAATSCGNAVIWMRRATMMPTVPPITIPSRISRYPDPLMPCCARVATTAMVMPIMPNRLPSREVTGMTGRAGPG